jgi:hypothetical protein
VLHLLTEQISDDDLAVLLEGFRTLAQAGNRVGRDLFCIVEREALRRHKEPMVAEYSDADLAGALAMLTAGVDASRAAGVPDSHPAVEFLLMAITSLAGEVKDRGLIQPLQ